MDAKKLKVKVKASMIEYLKTKGYPNMSIDEVLQELKPMWLKLEEEGLIQSGMSFRAFQEHAMERAIQASFYEHLFR